MSEASGKFSRTQRRNPTIKQMKALQFIAEGNSTRKAMILAGYSIKTANKGATVFKNMAVRQSLEGLKEYVREHGMTTEKMGDKLVQWIDQEKDVYNRKGELVGTAPDNEMQKFAYDKWQHLQEMGSKTNSDGKVKKRITFEEFIDEGEGQNAQGQ